jgi:hypothetical protein
VMRIFALARNRAVGRPEGARPKASSSPTNALAAPH